MNAKASSKGKFRRNSAAEEARIGAAIKADPDTRELTAADFAKMESFPTVMRRRGRPKAATHKVPVTLRLEPHVVEFFRRTGRGWQTRMNEALARYVARRREHE
jgi:uncharacterized protein (DUF4415 family)